MAKKAGSNFDFKDDEDDDRDYDDDDAPPRKPARSSSSSSSRRSSSGGGGGMGDYLSFKKMITPIVIQVIFWLGVALFTVGGILAAANSRDPLPGIAALLVGPVVWRIYCEILIVIFRMNDGLTDILNELKRQR